LHLLLVQHPTLELQELDGLKQGEKRKEEEEEMNG